MSDDKQDTEPKSIEEFSILRHAHTKYGEWKGSVSADEYRGTPGERLGIDTDKWWVLIIEITVSGDLSTSPTQHIKSYGVLRADWSANELYQHAEATKRVELIKLTETGRDMSAQGENPSNLLLFGFKRLNIQLQLSCLSGLADDVEFVCTKSIVSSDGKNSLTSVE